MKDSITRHDDDGASIVQAGKTHYQSKYASNKYGEVLPTMTECPFWIEVRKRCARLVCERGQHPLQQQSMSPISLYNYHHQTEQPDQRDDEEDNTPYVSNVWDTKGNLQLLDGTLDFHDIIVWGRRQLPPKNHHQGRRWLRQKQPVVATKIEPRKKPILRPPPVLVKTASATGTTTPPVHNSSEPTLGRNHQQVSIVSKRNFGSDEEVCRDDKGGEDYNNSDDTEDTKCHAGDACISSLCRCFKEKLTVSDTRKNTGSER